MSKKKKIGITLLILVLLIGGGTWFAYNKMTDYVIANMFEAMLMEDLEIQSLLTEDEQDLLVQQTPESQTNQGTGDQVTSIPNSSQAAEVATHEVTSIQSTGNQTTAKTKVDIKASVKEIVKSVSASDKNEMIKLVIQNISSSDIQYLSSLATDGEISGSDISEAKSVALRSFTEEQLEDVKNYYYQYIELFSEFEN